MGIFKRIASLLKGGLQALAGFASVLFTCVSEIGFFTRSKTLTVLIAFLMVAGGLALHAFLAPVFFYSYIALVFIGGIILRGYNSARSESSESEILDLEY